MIPATVVTILLLCCSDNVLGLSCWSNLGPKNCIIDGSCKFVPMYQKQCHVNVTTCASTNQTLNAVVGEFGSKPKLFPAAKINLVQYACLGAPISCASALNGSKPLGPNCGVFDTESGSPPTFWACCCQGNLCNKSLQPPYGADSTTVQTTPNGADSTTVQTPPNSADSTTVQTTPNGADSTVIKGPFYLVALALWVSY